jgi:tRNA1Val (adenine37-N6)-methyltransferase
MMTEENYLCQGERIDDLERSGLKIIQNPAKFCFGMDAVLLSGFARAYKGERTIDLGTGTGIIPILMSAKTKGESFVGLEIQKESADMAERSVSMNALQKKITIACCDFRDAPDMFGKGSFDVVTSNPPYIKDMCGISNPNDAKKIARHEIYGSLEDLIRTSAALLINGGRAYFVHRPSRLAEIMYFMHLYKLEPKRMRMVYPFIDREPNMVLIEGRHGAGSELRIEKPLIIYGGDGKYTDEIYDIYGY